MSAIFHTCSCGHAYTIAEWSELLEVGRQLAPANPDDLEAPEEYTLVLRDCRVCGSTRAMRADEERRAGIVPSVDLEKERQFFQGLRARLRRGAA